MTCENILQSDRITLENFEDKRERDIGEIYKKLVNILKRFGQASKNREGLGVLSFDFILPTDPEDYQEISLEGQPFVHKHLAGAYLPKNISSESTDPKYSLKARALTMIDRVLVTKRTGKEKIVQTAVFKANDPNKLYYIPEKKKDFDPVVESGVRYSAFSDLEGKLPMDNDELVNWKEYIKTLEESLPRR